jgi:hypothetical protein
MVLVCVCAGGGSKRGKAAAGGEVRASWGGLGGSKLWLLRQRAPAPCCTAFALHPDAWLVVAHALPGCPVAAPGGLLAGSALLGLGPPCTAAFLAQRAPCWLPLQGLKAALEAAVSIKGLLEMMFERLSEWINEFIADIEEGEGGPPAAAGSQASTPGPAAQPGGGERSGAAGAGGTQPMPTPRLGSGARRVSSAGERVAGSNTLQLTCRLGVSARERCLARCLVVFTNSVGSASLPSPAAQAPPPPRC